MTLPDQGTVLLYALSTLAQTCAALAAFVGAVGIFRLQVLRERYAALEREVRGWALEATRHDYWLMPMKEVLERIEKSEKEGNTSPYLKYFKEARTRWEAAPDQLRRSRDALLVFEAWNLLVILGSLGGFAHVPRLAALWWSGLLYWAVALITVSFTGWALVVWIGRYEPVEQTEGAGGGGSRWWQRIRQAVGWINRHGTLVTALITALATVVIAVLTGFYVYYSGKQWETMQQSNEHAYRAWLTVKHVRDVRPVIPGAYAELTAEIENTGRSPAQNVRVRAATAYQLPDWRIPDRVPEPSENNVGVIGPTQTRSIDFKKKDALNQADVDAINNGGRRIYWLADVTYSDQFGSNRLLQFCYVYEPPKPNKSMVSFPTFGSHESVK